MFKERKEIMSKKVKGQYVNTFPPKNTNKQLEIIEVNKM